MIFDQGHRIGELAWQRFPGGCLIKEDYLHIPEALKSTRTAETAGERIIYEATAIHDRVLVRPDILIRKGNAWDMVEVKGSTQVKDVYLDDVAIQKYVLDGADFRIRKCFVMHVNNQYVRRGEINASRFFTLADVTKEAVALQKEIPARVSKMHKVLALKSAPNISIGPHCTEPYECEFMDHCWKHIPDYSVFDLIRIRHEKVAVLLDRDIMRIRDIPENFPLTQPQELQVAVEKSGRPHIDRQEIAKCLREPRYPLHFIDFETIFPAIPPYDSIRPFQQIPFQASLHVQKKKDGRAEHLEYLGDAKTDPRPGLVAFLTESIGPEGSVVAYNAPFEGARLGELAEAYPRHAKRLLSVKNRLWDIASPFRMGLYVHPKFQGSWSIKAVLPALVPGMTYDGMTISNGGDASIAYLNLMDGQLSVTESKKIIRALRDYCGQDTMAMVKLLDVLHKEIGAR
ncbi:MAG: DUF2779 domain-containing protein [Elusimicrobiota bacterium]